jgi:hypothetical protein
MESQMNTTATPSSNVQMILDLVSDLTVDERTVLLAILAPAPAVTQKQTSTAAKIAASPFKVGDLVKIIPTPGSTMAKKWHGYSFTVTKVGTGGRLYGDNPENVDPVTGAQINPNKRLWPTVTEVELVKSAADLAREIAASKAVMAAAAEAV